MQLNTRQVGKIDDHITRRDLAVAIDVNLQLVVAWTEVVNLGRSLVIAEEGFGVDNAAAGNSNSGECERVVIGIEVEDAAN